MTIPLSKHILTDSHLKAIGLTAAEWSYTEIFLQQLIWEVAGIDNQRGYAMTSEIGSETRIQMLEALAETRLPSQAIKTKLKKALAEIRRLRVERNIIVHSLWLSANPKSLTLSSALKRTQKSMPASVQVKAKGKVVITNKPYPTKQILKTVTEIADLVGSLSNLLSDMKADRVRREEFAKALLAHQSPALDPCPNAKALLSRPLASPA